jgi:HlyD family secretion protein
MRALCLLAILCAGCGQRPQGTGVVAASAPPAKTPEVISCLGRLVPGQRILTISAPAQSIVKELRVQRGSFVRRGDVVAVLRDHDQAMAAVREAESEVAVSASEVEQAKAGERPAAVAAQDAAIARQDMILQDAERSLARKTSLSRKGDISSEELDRAQLAVNTAREALKRERQVRESLLQVRDVDVAAAEKKLARAVAKKERAQSELERYLILAPVSATVLEVHTYPGEAISSRGIADLGDTGNMFVEAEVYLTDVPRVRIGAPALITGEAVRGTLHGVVAEILREAGDSSLYPTSALTAADKRILRVRIRLDRSGAVQHLSNSQVSVRIEP